MNVQQVDNPDEFAAAATPLLMRNGAENCFWLGMLATPREMKEMMLIVRDDPPAGGECVAIATMTPGRQMIMTRAPHDAVVALAQHLHDHHVALPGIGGVRESAELFAREWVRLTGAPTRVHVQTILHQLTRVIPPRPTTGRMRTAGIGDIDRVARWIDEFRTEIEDHGVGSSSREIAEKRIPTGNIYLWEDAAKSVAMAGTSGPTPNGMRVNLVYTPRPLRARGYASNLVAQLSRHLVDGGRKFCFLYTDAANPTSNKIYRDIGYQPLSQSVHIMFDGAPGSH